MIFVNTHKLQILSVSCYGICFFDPADLELEICNVYFSATDEYQQMCISCDTWII